MQRKTFLSVKIRAQRARVLPFLSVNLPNELIANNWKETGLPSAVEAGDAFAHAPISQLIGLEVEPGPIGEAIVHLNVNETMHNPMGAVHGGIISLLADAAMGIAFGRSLTDPSAFATVEMKISYLRPVKATRLTCTAILVSRGLRIGFVECVITDARQKEVARGSCTCSVNSL